jgi:hypothetical protein
MAYVVSNWDADPVNQEYDSTCAELTIPAYSQAPTFTGNFDNLKIEITVPASLVPETVDNIRVPYYFSPDSHLPEAIVSGYCPVCVNGDGVSIPLDGAIQFSSDFEHISCMLYMKVPTLHSTKDNTFYIAFMPQEEMDLAWNVESTWLPDYGYVAVHGQRTV